MNSIVTYEAARDLLRPYIKESTSHDAPQVIATWAQSLDGFISREPGLPTVISCPESLCLTHTLRSMCDGILLGVSTIAADDPSLNVRLQIPGQEFTNPRPIILDSKLRCPENAKVLARSPIICTTRNHAPEKKTYLESLGATVLILDAGFDRVDVARLLPILKSQFGIQKVMVEGGASVLQEFIRLRLTDVCIVTIAPRLLGMGLHITHNVDRQDFGITTLEFKSSAFHTFGRDSVLIGYPTEGPHLL